MRRRKSKGRIAVACRYAHVKRVHYMIWAVRLFGPGGQIVPSRYRILDTLADFRWQKSMPSGLVDFR